MKNSRFWDATGVYDSTLNETQRAINDRLQRQIDDIYYKPITITAFTSSPSVAEIGSTIDTVNLIYALNKAPSSLKLDNVDQALNQNGTIALSDQNLSATKTYTLQAADSGSPSNPAAIDSKSIAINFYNSIYWGTAILPAEVSSTFVLSLSNRAIHGSRNRMISANAGSGQYIWYAVPVRLGHCTFKVGGFEGGFMEYELIEHTNASGYTENYYVYRSINAALGLTDVSIS